MDSNTTLYSVDEFNQANVDLTLKEVFASLKERGYDARKKIVSIDRSKIIEFLLNKVLGD